MEISILTFFPNRPSLKPYNTADCHMTTYYHNQIKQQTLKIILTCNLCHLLVRSGRYVTNVKMWPLYSFSVKYCIPLSRVFMSHSLHKHIGSNSPGIFKTVPDFLPLPRVLEGPIVCPGSKLGSCTMSRFLLQVIRMSNRTIGYC